MSTVKAGKYTAKIIDAGLMATKKGDPMVTIRMGFTDEEKNAREMTWFGATIGGAREITVQTLIRLGFKSDDLSDVAFGKEQFEYEADYEIVVENEANLTGVLVPKIKWINLPGSSAFREKMSKADAVKLCGGMSLKADFMDARQKLGKPKQPTTTIKNTEPVLEESDLLF